MSFALSRLILEPMVRNALHEDLGSYGDITTRTVVDGHDIHCQNQRPPRRRRFGHASRSYCFRLVDPDLVVKTLKSDGDNCKAGDALMIIEGKARSILSAERVALNFAGRLTGIATMTASFVAAAKGTNTRVTCTRKTTPGLRIVEKLAVIHGGGFNHRYSLSDAILVKDNHIAAAGGVRNVLESVKAKASHMMAVEIEVDTLEQLEEALEVGGANVVLLTT